MPRRRFIDKENATHFALVHRAQDDPLINDEDAPDMVFAEFSAPNINKPSSSKKVKERSDLEEEFGMSVRQNEGEAANYGVYYDDTEYDYMQHMRDLGAGGETYFVEASSKQKRGKGKQKLEDALREVSIDDDGASSAGFSQASQRSLMPEEMLPSEFVKKRTYQDQQNIPDALAGFQPDMDPRLREVLEALEDEAYVDDEDDIFKALAEDGVEIDQSNWEAADWEDHEAVRDDDQGWESDDTVKPVAEYKPSSTVPTDPSHLPPPSEAGAEGTSDNGDGAWMAEFSKFKKDIKASKPLPPAARTQSSILTGMSSLTNGGRHKKRKGAKTSTTNYSMTSSALARTEPLSLLDDRFDKIEEEYAYDELEDSASNFDDNDTASLASGLSHLSAYSAKSTASRASRMSAAFSQAPELVRADFDAILDEFLGGYSKQAGKGTRIRRGAPQTGMQQLDEIRQGLGPARTKARQKA
ncbi:hypothetical protein LTR04_001151 [Oleoguttula sp. CCFEE 6159]|nr:hypothetical protein LTR04_001151 [Oleoguttula sp. CCFEE 6159]